jgi:hypothetical protein
LPRALAIAAAASLCVSDFCALLTYQQVCMVISQRQERDPAAKRTE